MIRYLYKYMILVIAMMAALSCLPSYRNIHTGATVKDSLLITHQFMDKTICRDSVYERLRNDTLYIYKERLVDHYTFARDTIYIHRTDSVSVPVPVERTLTSWERFKMDWGGRFIAMIAVAIVFFFLRMYRPRSHTD